MILKRLFSLVLLLALFVPLADAQDIHQAVIQQDLGKIKGLLAENSELVNSPYSNGMSPLFFAVYRNNVEIAEYLISKGADVNHKTPDGMTPAVFAASRADARILDVLAKRGSALEIVYQDNSILQIALENNNKEVVDYLVQRKFPLPSRKEAKDKLLHQAVSKNVPSLYKSLLANGADLKSRNFFNGTLLHSAVNGSNKDLILQLISQGFDLDAIDDFGQTPMHYAVAGEKLKLTELLLEKGAKINKKDASSRTPLMIAEDHMNKPLKALLIAKGAKSFGREIISIGTMIKDENCGRSVEITQVANVGFLIKTKTKKILIDALTNEDAFSYFPTAKVAREMIISGAAPFDNIDLYLVSHNHGDHYSPEAVAGFMVNNRQCKLVAPANLEESFESSGQYASFKDRLTLVTTKYKVKKDLKLNGIKLTVYRAQHDSRPAMENNAHLFELDGIRFFHSGDFSGRAMENHSGFHWEQEDIDIAFLGAYFFWSEEITKIMRDYINPKHVIVTHIVKSNLNNVRKLHLESRDVSVFDDLPQKKIFVVE